MISKILINWISISLNSLNVRWITIAHHLVHVQDHISGNIHRYLYHRSHYKIQTKHVFGKLETRLTEHNTITEYYENLVQRARTQLCRTKESGILLWNWQWLIWSHNNYEGGRETRRDREALADWLMRGDQWIKLWMSWMCTQMNDTHLPAQIIDKI